MVIPLPVRHARGYQITCTIIFILTNSIALFANIADIPYYAFTLRRTTSIVFSQFDDEKNLGSLFLSFIVDYWYATLMFVALVTILIWATIKTGSSERKIKNSFGYYSAGVVIFVVTSVLVWGGIRGGFGHSTRPISLSNSGEYVEHPAQMAIVLNTPFAIIRTLGKDKLERLHYYDNKTLPTVFDAVQTNTSQQAFEPKNIVIIILESYSKEFVGALNKSRKVNGYTGYTPFLDSLIPHCWTFEHSFANGKKSIEALPSVLASIPSMEVPYVLSHYSSDDINSLFSLLKCKGYSSAFFHGAANGSMGFDAFMKIASADAYYGKTEYNHNEDYDGIWGIWDEPFFQYFACTMNTMKPPFCTTIFSVSSHHPFNVPPQYEGTLKTGPLPLHRCINYTDNAIRKFFATAKKMPWFKNTIFVITADHASFPYYKEYNNDADHFSIPLLFYAPDNSLAQYDTVSVAQQTDIMPTLLAMLHYDKPFVSFGKNLLDKTQPHFAMNYINGNYQLFNDSLLLQTDGTKINGFYNYASDKSLQKPLPQSAKTKVMMDFVKAFTQQYNNRTLDNQLTYKLK